MVPETRETNNLFYELAGVFTQRERSFLGSDRQALANTSKTSQALNWSR